MQNGQMTGYLTFTLHAHLPYVVHHGTWPHGLEWLHEAAAETYLPLLRVLKRLEKDGIALHANISLSPVLLEQLSHPMFREEFPKYLERKINSAREDENYFRGTGEGHFAATAQYWVGFFEEALSDFRALDGDIVGGFRHCSDAGLIEAMTSAASHAYLPLLGTEESITAQINTGLATHIRSLGRAPRGIWSPECGYRPAGHWQPAVPEEGEEQARPGFWRSGTEEAIAACGLEYFYVDTHLIEQARTLRGERPDLYRPCFVVQADKPRNEAGRRPVAVFPRDPRTGMQVWSSDHGYPGDGNYLDFHKKRWPGGHRYWQVTHSKSDMASKVPYDPQRARERTAVHAEHFVGLAAETLSQHQGGSEPPIITALYDAELFGHWWFEGPAWLEQVARLLARPESKIRLITSGEYLDRHPPDTYLALPEGSWGKGGVNEVWLNPETAWTWSHVYSAERRLRELASTCCWRDGGQRERILKQLTRELLLLESSDWQFLITTAAARDYAELRFITHLDQFRELDEFWGEFAARGELTAKSEQRLREIEERDSIFSDVDPGLWAASEANREEPAA